MMAPLPPVTTAKVAVCPRCGAVVGVESWYRTDPCRESDARRGTGTSWSHPIVLVPVVVPLP